MTAVGGAGSTRVVVAVGEAELAHRLGGVWFTDLTKITTDAAVPMAVAGGIGLSLHDGEPMAQIVEHLADKPALLILDNCEHVISGCAEFASLFLFGRVRRCCSPPAGRRWGSRASTRSVSHRWWARQRYGCSANEPRRPAQSSALDEDTDRTVTTICQRLDGLPLAIELAAAQATMLSPAEIEAALNDRFALLGWHGRRQPHQRTLVETLDWSFDLLDNGEQRVLEALGVFVGGFDLDAVAAVTSTNRTDAFTAVRALTDKSLVTPEQGSHPRRFRLLETVKAYAEDKLASRGDAADVHDQHLRHFHVLATTDGELGLVDIRRGIALRPERSNLTVAYAHAARTGRWIVAAELIAASYPAYIIDGAGIEAVRFLRTAKRD